MIDFFRFENDQGGDGNTVYFMQFKDHNTSSWYAPYAGSFETGDRIGDKITAAGTELTADYEISVSSDWNLENTYVYVLAIDALGYVNNMNFCAITDGNSDFNRVK
jgi:hypothetical protein